MQVPKTLQFVITSGMVNRQRFLHALEERMGPELRAAQRGDLMEAFVRQFDQVQIGKGSRIIFSTGTDGSLTTVAGGATVSPVFAPLRLVADLTHGATRVQVGHISSPMLAHVLFGLYLGPKPLQEDIRASFAKGIAAAILS